MVLSDIGSVTPTEEEMAKRKLLPKPVNKSKDDSSNDIEIKVFFHLNILLIFNIITFKKESS